MAQKSNKLDREQNRIKIDIDIGETTDINLNVRQSRNRGIPATAPEVSSHIRDLNSSIPLWSSFSWGNPPQKLDWQVQNPSSAEKPRPNTVTKVGKGIRKMNKLHPLPQSVRVLRYKLERRDHYQKDIPQPSISKISQTEKESQNSQHPDESYPCVGLHGTSLAPQTQMVNESNTQKVLERDPQTQVMTTNMSAGYKINPLGKHWWLLLVQGDLSSKVMIWVQTWIQIQLWLLKILSENGSSS